MPMPLSIFIAGVKKKNKKGLLLSLSKRRSWATEKTAGLISHSMEKNKIQKIAEQRAHYTFLGKDIMHSCNQRKRNEPDLALGRGHCWHKTRARCPWRLVLALLGDTGRRRCCASSEGQNPPASTSGGIGVTAGSAWWKGCFQSISTLVSYTWIPPRWRAAYICCLIHFLKQLSRE